MAVEVWVRNPNQCIKECIEVGMTNLVWDRGLLVKKGIDPEKFANVYFPQTMEYKMVVIGDSDQGAVEIRRGNSLQNPYKVHPLWEYGESLDLLESYCREAPEDGLVIVTRTLSLMNPLGKKFIQTLQEIQEDFPHAKIHVHGLYSWRTMFGLNFRSVDIEPRITAQKGKVILPCGVEVKYERAQTEPLWLSAVGFDPAELSIPRQRCMFNIKSALWAAEYFKVKVKFEHRRRFPVPLDGVPLPSVPKNSRIKVKNLKPEIGDMFLCDLCTMKLSCKYFRIGSVCSVPDSEGSELARMFKTRDSNTIIDGLGNLLALQVQRLEEGRAIELEDEKISPDVTRLVNTIFDRGVKLAKLVNPALAAASSPKVKVSFTQNSATISAANPTQLMAAIVNELESRGVERSQITPEMVRNLLALPEPERANVIDAVVASESI